MPADGPGWGPCTSSPWHSIHVQYKRSTCDKLPTKHLTRKPKAPSLLTSLGGGRTNCHTASAVAHCKLAHCATPCPRPLSYWKFLLQNSVSKYKSRDYFTIHFRNTGPHANCTDAQKHDLRFRIWFGNKNFQLERGLTQGYLTDVFSRP